MISVSELFEQQEKKPAAQSSAVQRRQWASQRLAELKSAAASGRVNMKTYQQKLKYWQKISSGTVGSKTAQETGSGPSADDLKTAGTFF